MNKKYMENNNDMKQNKMVFIMNAIEDGWRVKKKKSLYIFEKKHNGQRASALLDLGNTLRGSTCRHVLIVVCSSFPPHNSA